MLGQHTSQRKSTLRILIRKLKHKSLRIMAHRLTAVQSQRREAGLSKHHRGLVLGCFRKCCLEEYALIPTVTAVVAAAVVIVRELS